MSEASGRYRGRPSIARFIEEAIDHPPTASDHAVVSLDVLSDHHAYLGDDGRVAGLFVVMGTPLPLGAAMLLEVRLPWGERFEISGEVEWVVDTPRSNLRQRPGVGVRLELVEHHRQLLDAALALHAPISPPPEARRC